MNPALQAAAARQPYCIRAGWVGAWQHGQLQLLPNTTVCIEAGRISQIDHAALPGNLPCLDLPNHLLLPGLISGHTHVAAGTPTRGIIEGGRSFALPLQLVEQLDDQALDALTAHNLYEIIRSGCTTQIEMSLSLRQAQSYLRIAKRWGVRGYVGPMIPGIERLFPIWFRQADSVLFDAEPATLAEIATARQFAETADQGTHGLIRVVMAPHAADTHTTATLQALRLIAQELTTGIHIHLSQSVRETQTVQRLWGATPTSWLQSLGLFEGPTIGAHLVGLDWHHDPAILTANRVIYAHCPSGGGAGGAAQPYPEALGAGVATNIAIDTHSNDMLENIKLAVLYGQARYAALAADSPYSLAKPTIHTALAGATTIIADHLGRPDLGRIAVGACADLIAIDLAAPLSGIGGLPPEPLHHLLYANGQSVSHVIIDGRFLIVNGELTVADTAQVTQQGYAAVQHIWQGLRQQNWFAS
jgi:5-methylthioadenosine/S-adenosylhomocysteine deaminase